ncbi:TIGR03067 domain-containing protein [Zavarzinella formosa]|uniref:TIGR03067 domain-containing protein n=1 Tax=Zavarzinella formosa TaxID=360055 RepID=UPI0002D4F578|nr:TIGR03067 domain-containing protein [Zavarzinella formosa]
MFRFIAPMLALAITTATMAEEKEKAKFDPKAITGTWTIVSGMKYGTTVESKALEGDVIITADKITIKSPDKTHVMTYKLDAAKTPINIDMEGLEGDAKGFKAEGIIELTKDELKLAYSFPGEKRPAKLESEKDSKVLFFTMKKK